MTLYEFLLFVHVLMAVVWVGGSLALQVQAVRIQRAGLSDELAALGRQAEWFGTRVFMPASILLLASGIWAASEGDWDFGSAWISIGFTGVVLSAVAGIVYFGPESGRIARLVDSEGAASPNVKRRLGRLLTGTRIELLILVVVIWAMVTKPGL